MPEPKTPKVHITVYVDASHASDQTTRRSVTGYLIFLGHAPVTWYSKRQNTVETSTYGSELVALRIATEALLAIRYKLRMMGIDFHHTATILCDNMSVVINMQLPSSSLKKKHNSVAYHRSREVVSIGVARLGHVSSKTSMSDILTKPGTAAAYHVLLSYPMYNRVPQPKHRLGGVVENHVESS